VNTRLPLAIALYPRDEDGSDPAVWLRFTSVSFDPIDPSVFRFTPPPGARVRDIGLEGADADRLLAITRSVRTFGSGWTSVLALRTPGIGQGPVLGPLTGALRFQGSIVSLGVIDRGSHSWVLIGTVPLARLEALEATLP
jgi:hypothetical protein